MKRVKRKKAFYGALASAVIGIGTSIWNAQQNKRLMEKQQQMQRESDNMNNSLEYATALTNKINNDDSENEYARQSRMTCGGKKRIKRAVGGNIDWNSTISSIGNSISSAVSSSMQKPNTFKSSPTFQSLPEYNNKAEYDINTDNFNANIDRLKYLNRMRFGGYKCK